MDGRRRRLVQETGHRTRGRTRRTRSTPMRTTPRTAAAGLSLLAASALLAGTATAQSSEYRGTASAEALTIVVFGQTITTSASTADLTPALAKATATQVLTPLQKPPAQTAET